jgi:protein-tyrosine kinase
MSLVERAAKRLEELGKAGVQVAGDLAYPTPRADTPPSLLERAIRKVEGPEPAAGGFVNTNSPTPVQDSLEATSSSSIDRTGHARREPKLGDVAIKQTDASEEQLNRQRVELDLSKITSAGYLQPEDSESEVANEFRKIKRPLIKACQGKTAVPIHNANRIMVTSSIEGEGKSFVALNLALSIAMERDSTVLLIDADTTRPRLSQLAGIDTKFGLLDLLAGDDMLQVPEALFRTNIEKLTLLPAGKRRRHATELLASGAMERLLQHLASRYADRILIFDAPPLLGAPEPAVLASHMGQIIVVVEADKTMQKVLTKALTTIQSCPVVTTVLNKAPSTEQGYFYAG